MNSLDIAVIGHDAAEFLLAPQEGQFGIGIPSGVDFIIHSTMADIKRQLKPFCEFLEVDGAWLVQGISGRLDLLKEESMVGQVVCVVVREVG